MKQTHQRRTKVIALRLTRAEADHVKHAAGLVGMPLAEYVREAVNWRLRKEGVDALLLKLRADGLL